MTLKNKVNNVGESSLLKSKEMFFANLNLSPRPVVCLSRLNIPAYKTKDFVINVNSKEFKLLVPKIKTHKSKYKIQASKITKPKVKKNRKQSRSYSKNKKAKGNLTGEVSENGDESFSHESSFPNINSEGLTESGNKENEWSLELQEDEDEAAGNDGSQESMTRIDKVIDTFLYTLKKTTDDDTILAALQRDYICGKCQRGFLKKETLSKHIKICLGMKTPKKRKYVGNYTCPMCDITYARKYSLEKHNANVHNLKKLYKCLVCSHQFYNEEALTLHCRRRHGLGGTGIYKCPYCEASFNIRDKLNVHCRRTHNTARTYLCPMCLECFKSEETLKLHKEGHGFCCEVCMFRTKDESEMSAHRLTHLYIVVHKCDKCLRTFKAKRDFTKHIKVHEKEKKL